MPQSPQTEKEEKEINLKYAILMAIETLLRNTAMATEMIIALPESLSLPEPWSESYRSHGQLDLHDDSTFSTIFMNSYTR